MEIEDRIAKLENDLEAIRMRNARVDADKAWETSSTRTALIAFVTYLSACGFLAFINTDRWWLNALLPPAGYFLSTQSLHLIKTWWLRGHHASEK